MSRTPYKGYTREELEIHFNPQNAVADHAVWSEKKNQACQKVRAGLKSFLDVPYGATPRQKVDIFPAAKPAAPVLLYFHGGHWGRAGQGHNSPLPRRFLAARATVGLR